MAKSRATDVSRIDDDHLVDHALRLVKRHKSPGRPGGVSAVVVGRGDAVAVVVVGRHDPMRVT